MPKHFKIKQLTSKKDDAIAHERINIAILCGPLRNFSALSALNGYSNAEVAERYAENRREELN